MKNKKNLLGLLAFLPFIGYAQSTYYYYYKGEKQYVELNTKQVFMSVEDTNN